MKESIKPTKRPGALSSFGRTRRWFSLLLVVVALVGIALFLLSTSSNTGNLSNDNSEGSANPLAGKRLYVDPQSNAAKQAASWRTSRPDDAKQMDRLAMLPSSKWYGEKATIADMQAYVQAAKEAEALPVLVAYNIVNRDCGKYSAGGAKDVEAYKAYINTMKTAIADAPAVVVLEPDALVQIDAKRSDGQDCLTPVEKDAYLQLTKYSVDTLKSLPNTVVYIDAGNSGWLPDATAMATKLTKAGIREADGFTLNVSNFRSNDETINYGIEISGVLGGTHFVVDTSRNGLGPYDNPYDPAYNWCNPPGRALGHYPTTETGKELVDAYLFIKNVGESDGSDPNPRRCFGGPKAGEWWPEYALGLIQRWPADLQPR